MEFQKIVNLLDISSDNKDLPRFVTKKLIEVYDQSEKSYNPNKEIRIKTSMLRSDSCGFSDACITVKQSITVDNKTFTADDFEAPNNTAANATATNNANNNAFGEKKLIFKNNAPFTNCIKKINGIKIDNAEDLDVVMPMSNLLEYSKNYKKTTGSLWNYYRDEPNSSTDNNNLTHSISNSKSFDYKANFIGSVTKNNLIKNDDPIVHKIANPENATFKITEINFYIPVITLSKENDIKLLEKLKSGFKRTIKWNKY